MENLTQSFIRKVRLLAEDNVNNKEVCHQLKRCVLDWYGVTVAGASLVKERMQPFVSICGDGSCSSFATDRKLDLCSAASLNAFMAHAMELDDGHRFGMLHLEAPIISAMVALAEYESLNCIQFFKGIIAGYQTTIQLARCIQPNHKKSGYHATGTCGAIGVAVAIATALNYSDKEFENAISAATTRAAGLLSVIDAPSEMKPYNVFGAAEVGIRAAYLAKSGFVGPVDPLAGKRGFLRVYAPEVEDTKILEFAEKPEILNIYFKPYVSCRHCHAPAEGALNLASKYQLDWHEIATIRVETYLLAIGGHDSIDIDSVSAAKMSIPYCVAISILRGSCGLDSFTEDNVSSESLKALVKKVKVVEDENLTRVSPGKRGARVIITLCDGRVIEEFVDNPLGEPEHPISDEALEQKYAELMSSANVAQPIISEIKDCIWNLESNYNSFMKIVSLWHRK